jgi:tRNA-dihydrouridine synthase B
MSFSIGPVAPEAPVFLAPMSGVTDLPFRRLVRRLGAGLVFSEMIASRPMLEEYRRRPARASAWEGPMAVQIAGCEPEIMAEAARVNEGLGAAIIDINFGCPVKKVVNKLAGSALMKEEPLAAAIMQAVAKAVKIPVTVKMRLGWDENDINAPRLAKIAEDAGLRMITVHGRTRNQLFNGNANWDAVRAVKQAVRIPVVVNGDILSPQDAARALEASGADGVMIGRGCYGRPWLLRQTMDYLKSGKPSPAPAPAAVQALMRAHYEDMLSHHGTRQGVMISRKHLSWYCRDYKGALELKNAVNRLEDPALVWRELDAFFGRLTETAAA